MYSILFYTAEDRIGDALIKLPAILGLRNSRSDVSLTWTTGAKSSAFTRALAPLVRSAINEIHENSKLGSDWRTSSHPLRERHFDCVIVSETKLRSTLMLKKISHDLFIAPCANFLFSDRKPAQRFAEAISEQTRTLFELAIDASIQPTTKLLIPAHELSQAHDILPDGRTYVGLAPGAGGIEKCWPLERYISVARAQTVHQRVPAFFLGPMEREWRLKLQLSVPEAVFPEYSADGSLLGGPVLTIALATRLKLAVANDAGAGHLLAAGGRPIVSLFGTTDPKKFESPYAHQTVISALRFGSSHVSAIPVSYVIAAIDDLCALPDE